MFIVSHQITKIILNYIKTAPKNIKIPLKQQTKMTPKNSKIPKKFGILVEFLGGFLNFLGGKTIGAFPIFQVAFYFFFLFFFLFMVREILYFYGDFCLF